MCFSDCGEGTDLEREKHRMIEIGQLARAVVVHSQWTQSEHCSKERAGDRIPVVTVDLDPCWPSTRGCAVGQSGRP